ncbi:MAG: hypothetical protein WC919_00300 [Candidatus Paceibacterota bacterium]|jgi:hypothetical protein
MTDKSEQICDHLWTDLREVLDACPDPICDILETGNLVVMLVVQAPSFSRLFPLMGGRMCMRSPSVSKSLNNY